MDNFSDKENPLLEEDMGKESAEEIEEEEEELEEEMEEEEFDIKSVEIK
jgi:hypothetical protein